MIKVIINRGFVVHLELRRVKSIVIKVNKIKAMENIKPMFFPSNG
jgi:hypothetical protein